jgi:hypothetical protein
MDRSEPLANWPPNNNNNNVYAPSFADFIPVQRQRQRQQQEQDKPDNSNQVAKPNVSHNG